MTPNKKQDFSYIKRKAHVLRHEGLAEILIEYAKSRMSGKDVWTPLNFYRYRVEPAFHGAPSWEAMRKWLRRQGYRVDGSSKKPTNSQVGKYRKVVETPTSLSQLERIRTGVLPKEMTA